MFGVVGVGPSPRQTSDYFVCPALSAPRICLPARRRRCGRGGAIAV